MEKCIGSKTSVYTGSFTDDYRALLNSDPELGATYASTGLAASMLANRISWFFDLNGPSVNLDAACSSSLMALDIACKGLQNGEASMVSHIHIYSSSEIEETNRPKELGSGFKYNLSSRLLICLV